MKYNPTILIDHIDSRIDLLDQRIQQETKQLKVIVLFFQSLSKEVDKFSKGYHKVVQTLKASLCLNNGWGNQLQGILDEHTEIAKALGEFEAMINSSITEPLDVFTTKYQQRNTNVLAKALTLVNLASSKGQTLDKFKKKFFKYSKAAMGCTKEGAYKSKLKAAEESRNEYTEQIKVFNKTLEEIRDKYSQHLKSWLVNEECKLNYVKNMLWKFNTITNGIGKTCTSCTIASEKLLNTISTTLAIKDYIVVPTMRERVFGAAFFETPNTEEKEVKLNHKRLTEICPVEATEEGVEFVKNSMQLLLDNKSIPDPDKPKLMEIARTERGLKTVCKSFSRIMQKIEINDYSTFNLLSEITSEVLDQISNKKDLDIKQITLILGIGGFISYYNKTGPENKRVLYLRDSLTRNSIWKVKDIWYEMIKFKIKKSFENLRSYMKYKKSDVEEEKVLFIGDSNTRVKQEEQEKIGKKGIATTELALFALEMAFYSIDIERSREFIISIGKEYGIEGDKLYNIMSEYEMAQTLPRDEEVQFKEILNFILNKKKKKVLHYEFLEALRYSLKYVSEVKDLRNILILNKKAYKFLKIPIYKQVLNISNSRLLIWNGILNDTTVYNAYSKIKAEQVSTSINKKTDNVICLNVDKTFHALSKEDKDSITSILSCYAIYNPEIEYCQGINYIAAMFFILYKDEAMAFMMLAMFVKKCGLVDLFKRNMSMLKMYLYTLNKLIAIYIPELHIHLFEENVNAACFSSPWILTTFTVILQYPEIKEVPPLLLMIYDEILTKGFKAILKVSLFILDYHKEQLLTYRDNQILQFLNNLPAIFYNQDVIKAYKNCKYNITKELLDELNERHKEILIRCDLLKDEIVMSRQEFKHLVRAEDKFTQIYLSK